MIATVRYLLLLTLSLPVLAAPSSQYWSLWDQSDHTSIKRIDHSAWQAILDRYLVSRPDGNLLKYSQVTKKDRQKLEGYLNHLAGLDPRQFNRSEQKAYWINLYNALTVNLVLEHYPVKSITKIGSWFSFGPWDQRIVKVASENLTLNDIVHRIIRPIWKDKRIHYAVNCASKGCPDLSPTAYTGANIGQQLEDQAERFIRQEKGLSWIDGKLILSRVYEWYGKDFGSRDELMLHLRKHSTPRQRVRLLKYTGVTEYQYSWSLNELK